MASIGTNIYANIVGTWRQWKNLYFIDCEYILSLSSMCRRGETNLWWNCLFSTKETFITDLCQFKCWKYFFPAELRLKIAKFIWGWPPASLLFLEQTKLVCQTITLLNFFSMYNITFPLFYQCMLFYFGDRPWRCIFDFWCI